MRFEHLVEINDPGNPQLDPLTPDQLWQGLVLRAESPELFVLGLDSAEVVGRGDSWIDRVLHFGAASIHDRVVFEPRRQVRYETAATAEHAGGTLTMAIETPGPGALLLRFVYDTTMPAVDASGDARYAEIVKSAYHEADIDTVRKIREIADTGRAGVNRGPVTPEGSGQPPGGPTRQALRARYGDRLRWLVLMTLMLGTISSIVSSTIVNVAIPDLSQHFALGQERAQWVAASFMIAMTLSMLLTPWLLNRYGLRRTFLGASVLLGVGGFFGGFSPTYGVMIAMRAAEGVAAGIMQPLPNILILRSFEEREQGKAISAFGFGVVLAPALGPSLGGFLVEAFGWRSIFFVVVPLTLIGVVMARRFMAVDSIMIGEREPLDWRGLGLAGIATVSLLNGVVQMRDSVPAGLALAGFGVLMLAAFVLWQLRAAYPLMNLRLYSYRQFAAGAVVAFIYGAGLFGSTYLLPVYMQMALEYTPSRAGLVLLPAGVALALTIGLAGRFTNRIAPHVQVSFGLALLALSFVLMALGSRTTPYLVLVALAILGRIGLGCILPSLTLGAMRGVDFSLIAQGSSCINFLRQLGGAIGVSLAGVGLQWRLAEHGAVAGQAGDAALQAARIRAFDETFLAVGVVIASAMFSAWRIRPRPVPAG